VIAGWGRDRHDARYDRVTGSAGWTGEEVFKIKKSSKKDFSPYPLNDAFSKLRRVLKKLP
jgi:hypothetical protein